MLPVQGHHGVPLEREGFCAWATDGVESFIFRSFCGLAEDLCQIGDTRQFVGYAQRHHVPEPPQFAAVVYANRKVPCVPDRLFRNTLLSHLDPDTVSRLQLRRVELPILHQLEMPGSRIDRLYFIEEGIGSMTTRFDSGVQVETSMFGYESAVGVSALMGTKLSLNAIFMQLAGYGYASPVEAAREEFLRGGRFQELALRYVQAQLTLSTQNAACNAVHTHEQRLARWLLICGDRARQTHLAMAQDFVSQMLGSTRSTVSIAASGFKAKGLIDYSRGSIRILNPEGLEAEACECYRVVREHLENAADFDTGFVV